MGAPVRGNEEIDNEYRHKVVFALQEIRSSLYTFFFNHQSYKDEITMRKNLSAKEYNRTANHLVYILNLIGEGWVEKLLQSEHIREEMRENTYEQFMEGRNALLPLVFPKDKYIDKKRLYLSRRGRYLHA